MKLYALNLAEDKRILSACVILPNGNYDGMPLVNVLPNDDVSDYLYIDGQYVYDPLPEPEQSEINSAPSAEERIEALEAAVTMLCMPDASEV